MIPILAVSAAGLAVQLILWGVQRRTRNAATVDLGWTILMIGGIVAAAVLSSGDGLRRLLVGILGSVWAGRLGLHLLRDRVLGARQEDGRYRTLRERWGPAAGRNFLLVYLAQGVIAVLFVIPVAAAMRGGSLDGWAAAGVGVWLIGVGGEALADRQLARFRADPAHQGAVCDVGLWRYSRHPNYFFEWVHWWAYVVVGQAAPLTLVGPAAMLLFLYRITGIPYTERQALQSRGEAYRDYQRSTSAFVPWPPRRAIG